jgi:hypothetical protein
VEPGYDHAIEIGEDRPLMSNEYRLLFYPNDRETGQPDVRFEHTCDRGTRGIIRCAPRLTNINQPGGHQVTGPQDSPTVRASIMCDDCGTHGFITEGRWEPA